MSRTACYICNFNGKEYVRKCVESIFEQVEICDSFHLYMVDNASTDGSADYIRDLFQNKITVIENPINLGGAGGFNTALRDAIEKKYDYVILLDNDIVVDEGCVENFIRYIEGHPDVGCVGAKIMIMDRPNYIQEFGGQLDFERYDLIKNYWYELDQGTEIVIESDWVSSCALIARVNAVEKTTLFPEENFLFWDDIDFTYQIKVAGYKVHSLASAKVYHKGKKKPITNTALGYYGMRNRIKFFSKYESEERLSHLCRNMLDEYFQVFFGNASKGFKMSNKSRMFALDDFVHKNYGRADEFKIYPMDAKNDKIKRLAQNQNIVYIEFPKEVEPKLLEAVGELCRRLDEINNIKRVVAFIGLEAEVAKAKICLKRYYDGDLEFVTEYGEAGVIFRPCFHIKEVTEDISPIIWFDKYLNCVESKESFENIKAYPYIRDFFVDIHYEWLLQGIRAERRR